MSGNGYVRKRETPPMEPEEFIRIWQTAKVIGEVTAKTKLTKDAAYQRARLYRRKGVKLKYFPRPWDRDPTDWKALAKLAAKLRPEK